MAVLKYASATKWTSGQQVQVGDIRWIDGGAGPVFYRALQTSTNAAPPNATYWTAAPGMYVAGVKIVVDGVTERWTGKTTVYDVLDDPLPAYAVAPAARSGKFQLLVGDPAERAALLNLLGSGDGLVLVKDDPVSDTDWCETGGGFPVVDVSAFVVTSAEETFAEGDEDWMFFDVEWVQVTDREPAALP